MSHHYVFEVRTADRVARYEFSASGIAEARRKAKDVLGDGAECVHDGLQKRRNDAREQAVSQERRRLAAESEEPHQGLPGRSKGLAKRTVRRAGRAKAG